MLEFIYYKSYKELDMAYEYMKDKGFRFKYANTPYDSFIITKGNDAICVEGSVVGIEDMIKFIGIKQLDLPNFRSIIEEKTQIENEKRERERYEKLKNKFG